MPSPLPGAFQRHRYHTYCTSSTPDGSFLGNDTGLVNGRKRPFSAGHERLESTPIQHGLLTNRTSNQGGADVPRHPYTSPTARLEPSHDT